MALAALPEQEQAVQQPLGTSVRQQRQAVRVRQRSDQ